MQRRLLREKQDKAEEMPISDMPKLSTYLRNQPVELANMVAEFLQVSGDTKKERIAAISTAMSGNGPTEFWDPCPKRSYRA